ncbi:T9SS type A sorting domain-containing protein [Ekhidna sp. To15]|uniref:T9SS type A sorting domain-containing protein n=1 Tax=Ekhidna sp. To15 TaxID=3395267 RepID=UPI003F524E4D
MKSTFFKNGFFAFFLLSSGLLNAQTWVGGGSNWNDPANWTPGLPSNGSTIYINGNLAIVDVVSDFRPDQIHIQNGGELRIANTLDIGGEMYTYVSGSNSKLAVVSGGLFTSEFITVTNGGEIEITGGELDVSDKLSMTDATLTISGGLLDNNGVEGEGEQLILTNSTFSMTGGEIQSNSSIIVTGGTFTMESDATLTVTNENRNLEFHDAAANLDGTIDLNDDPDLNYWGDLSLYGTSVVDLQADLVMNIDDLILNDDGQSSTLNIYGSLVTFDDLLFDQDLPGDVPNDVDRIIIKDGGSLDIQDRWKGADALNSGSGIHVESGGTLNISIIEMMTAEEAYGTVVTSDDGANVTLEGEPALPVELLYFEGEKTENEIYLKWSTAVEINNDYFEVLKSTDGQNFYSITKINGFGNSNNIVEYSFADLDVSNGNYFYQLKQVDFNGEFEYHQIISISFSIQEDKISVFPNPVTTDQFKISANRTISQPVLTIYSTEGGIVHERKLSSNNRWTINQSEANLPRGVYILIVHDEANGTIMKSTRISIAN